MVIFRWFEEHKSKRLSSGEQKSIAIVVASGTIARGLATCTMAVPPPARATFQTRAAAAGMRSA